MAAFTSEEIKRKISRVPRRSFILLPTPLHKLQALSAELGGPEIFIKRDDLTGIGFGGNKSRKLEFIIADALAQGADSLITWGSLQSNWCLQAAAAARRFGLKPVLILFKTNDLSEEFDGNLLLDRILGANILIREARKGKVVRLEDAFEIIEEAASGLRAGGHQPYLVAVGGSLPGGSMTKPLGAVGYLEAFVEMLEQGREQGIGITHVLHATGSGATQAGLTLGAAALAEDVKVLGISVSDEREIIGRDCLAIGRALDELLDLGLHPTRSLFHIFDEYLKEGYGIVNREVAEALRLVFRLEGVILDPVYTGKAMSALIDLAGKGYFQKNDRVVFFHTGGTPALFPNRKTLVELLGPKA